MISGIFLSTLLQSSPISKFLFGFPLGLLDILDWLPYSSPDLHWGLGLVLIGSLLVHAYTDPFPLRQQAPPPPVEIEGDIEYEVSKILDTKLDRRFQPDNALHYLVRWTGYKGTDNETSWIPARDLEHAPELVQSFHHCYPNKPKPAIITS